MKEVFVILNNNIKRLVKKSWFWGGIAFAILLSLIIGLYCMVIYIYLELSDGQYHFYMNTKKSLENIHNVKIDRYDGGIERELSTEEILIRRNNSRWHLRKMFK